LDKLAQEDSEVLRQTEVFISFSLFRSPESFVLHQTASAILGLREHGAEALRIDFVQVPLEHPLTDYDASGWLENIEQSSIEPLNMNGFPAVTARAESNQWVYRVFVIRLDRGQRCLPNCSRG
jgi:predicted Zn-dependent protease